VRVFFDPSVPYGLQFDTSDLAPKSIDEAEPAAPEVADGDGIRPEDAASGPLRPAPRHALRETPAEPGVPAKVRAPRKPRAPQVEPARQVPAAQLPSDPTSENGVGEPAAGAALSRSPAGRPMLVQPKPDEPANDSKVVQLDKFRKR
jgi:hypothetical protein